MEDCTAKVIASSICHDTGARIDTLQLRYPRIIHAEFMTHRMFSRNASSSRAIPVASMTEREQIFIPTFAKNKPGMQAGEALSEVAQAEAAFLWEDGANYCLNLARQLSKIGVHKQWANRPLEWFGYIDVVVTSTNWSNYDALRDHPDAQPEIADLCRAMKAARDAVEPFALGAGEWHLPYVTEAEADAARDAMENGEGAELVNQVRYAFTHAGLIDVSDYMKLLIAVSVARCCRVSYAKHDGTPSTLAEDIQRFMKLAQSDILHASPFEHQARPLQVTDDPFVQGNFHGWAQFRKFIPYECL